MATDRRPVVIGAGVIGCSIAYALSKRGARPIVVDRGPGAGAGSTSASSAVIRFSYSTIDAVRLSWESKFHWEHWRETIGHYDDSCARFVKTGLLVLESPVTPLSAVRAHFDAVGVPYEALGTAALAARFPDLDLGRFGPPKRIADPAFWDRATGEPLTGYLTPDAGYVDDPALAAHNLMVAAQAHGAEFRFRCAVTGFVDTGGRVDGVVTASGDVLPAAYVVNAAGPHSAVVNRLAGLPASGIQTRALRQEVHVVRAPSPFDVEGGGVAIGDADLGTYMRPHLGGTLMIGGLEPECDPLEWIGDPDQFNEYPTAEGWEAQTTRAARRLTSLGVPPSPSGLAALYDVSDDWMPVYDRSDREGFYVAIGTSGNQFKNAPVVGDLMATLIDAVEAGHDHDSDPITFTGPYTRQVIDLGAFSRHRVVHATTNSVLG